MYLEKTITDQYGHTDTAFVVDITENLYQNDDGSYTCSVKLLAYKDAQSIVDGKQFTDCFRPVLSYVVTLQEKNAAPGILDKEKLMYCFASKVIESILDSEGNETNLCSGNIGQVGFQDAMIK